MIGGVQSRQNRLLRQPVPATAWTTTGARPAGDQTGRVNLVFRDAGLLLVLVVCCAILGEWWIGSYFIGALAGLGLWILAQK